MSLNSTPRANRLHIGFFGRRNSGKSSLLNALAGQEVAIVSPVLGTTTDPVYKAMEIHGLGPCVLIDTAGFDDEGAAALHHRAFLFPPNSEAVGPACSKRQLLWKSSGDPFIMWPPRRRQGAAPQYGVTNDGAFFCRVALHIPRSSIAPALFRKCLFWRWNCEDFCRFMSLTICFPEFTLYRGIFQGKDRSL